MTETAPAGTPPSLPPAVLLADKDPKWRSSWRVAIPPGIEVLETSTLRQTETVFRANRSRLALIVLASSLGKQTNQLNTLELIRFFRACGYTGPIIAAASTEADRQLMVKAGCTHVPTMKSTTDVVITQLLNPGPA